jgi:hypothetical protein
MALPWFFLILFQISLSAPSDTLYISTIGTKFFVNSASRFPAFILLRIEEKRDAQQALEFLSASCATGDQRYRTALNTLMREIDNCDYRKQSCFLLLSPRTHDLRVDQPFLLPGARRLIFRSGIFPEPDADAYLFTRLLIATKSERDLEFIVRTPQGEVAPATYHGSPP